MDKPESPGSRGRVLVVDDDRLVLVTLAQGLMRAGFEVLQADNGDDAILLARQRQPGAALLDIRMQGLSGFDVAQYLRDYCRIPFMFLSAYADEDTRAQARALGAAHCLGKPIALERLLPLLDELLQSSTQGKESSTDAEGGASGLDSVAVAVGILMHRYSLDRRAALARLHSMAHHEGLEAVEVASEMVQAVERLAAAASPSIGAGRGSTTER